MKSSQPIITGSTLISCVLLFGINALLAENYLAIRYDMDITFMPAGGNNPAQITGINHITITNNWVRPLEDIYLHNNSNGYFSPEDKNTPHTVIGEVKSDHLDEVLERDAISMRITLDPPVPPGESLEVEVPFVTHIARNQNPFAPTMGSNEDTTIYNLIFFYPVLEYFHDDGWHIEAHQGKADPYSNMSEYQVTFTFPVGYQVGTSAHLVTADTLENEMARWRLYYPKAISFSAVLSEKFKFKREEIENVNLEMLYTPGQAGNVEKLLKDMRKIVPYYVDRFGACPNDKLTVTMAYSLGKYTGALATTNYIIYQNSMSSVSTLAHEFAHQWFGGSINADQNSEGWLNESFAEYAAREYLQMKSSSEDTLVQGPSDKLVDFWSDFRTMKPERLYWLLHDLLGDRAVPPIYQRGELFKWEDFENANALLADVYRIYYAGSNALQMLHSATGDSVMHNIMLTYNRDYAWKTVETDSFISVVQDLAGSKIAGNFYRAVTTRRRPDLRIADVGMSRNKDQRWNTQVTADVVGSWLLPVDIRIITADGDTLTRRRVWLDEVKELSFTTAARVSKIELDPRSRMFDFNRANNSWPRRFQIQPIFGLPRWDIYKLYLRPRIHKDWRGDWRYGLHLQGGLGLNLMPFTPSFFKHAFKMDLTYSPAMEGHEWGGHFLYRNPLRSSPLAYWEAGVSYAHPRIRQHVALGTYLGQPAYYFNGGKADYLKLTHTIVRTEYTESREDAWWPTGTSIAISEDIVRYHHSATKQLVMRSSHVLGIPTGRRNNQVFYRFTILYDIEHSLPPKITARFWSEVRFAWDKRFRSDLRSRLGQLPGVWSDETGASRFRGRTDVDAEWWDSMVTGGFSIKPNIGPQTAGKPVAYLDWALVDNQGGLISERVEALRSSSPVYLAAGLGLESRTIVHLGVYFPFWVSHPPDGESNLKFRTMAQLSLNW